ncbi:MAG: hypothetical protein HKN56_06805 [Gammaproteobacteria bacterium]|nr:hypothetical protein [Gammaproteobacteria bacterium]
MSSAELNLKNGRYWLLTIAAGIALLLVVANTILARANQEAQEEIDSRQLYINQSIRVSRLNTQVIQALANLSARTGDEQIRKLLADHGISFTGKAAQPQADTGSADGEEPDETN